MHLSGVGPVAFLWSTIFALGAQFLLGAQKPPLMRILPSHSGEDQKKEQKSSSKMHFSGIGPVAFFWGTIFVWGTHSRLGAPKPLLVRILPSHSGMKTKTKTKRSLSQMHPNGVGPATFFWGTHSRLGAQKPLLVRILPSHSGMKTKAKTKRSLSQMHPNGVGPIAFFWGTILARLRVTAPK